MDAGHALLLTLMFWVFLVGCPTAMGLTMWANALDRREEYVPDAPTPIYALFGVPCLVILFGMVVRVVVQDPCAGDMPWWLALLSGCLWN